jgi:hypothetical protein
LVKFVTLFDIAKAKAMHVAERGFRHIGCFVFLAPSMHIVGYLNVFVKSQKSQKSRKTNSNEFKLLAPTENYTKCTI